ncbi:hypothetical protein [Flavobacterium beibuense]|nr:hypothetical protein [Flavobacterium beibuense]
MKRYEILKSLPPYGPMYISIPNNNTYSEELAVRFFKSDNTEWIANFQNGDGDLTVSFELNKHIVIIANGICYVMNPDEQKPISTFGRSLIYANQLTDDRIILTEYGNISIIEKDGTTWHSNSIGPDDLTILKIESNIIYGQYSDYMGQSDEEWNNFTLNIDTKEIKAIAAS